jgi:pyruvate kinase
VLTTDELIGGVHDGVKKVAIDHRSLHEEVSAGDRILIDDGLFEFVVERIEGREIFTHVINGGRLKPRKGVNLPNIKLKISAITEKDRRDLQFAYDHGLDYVALSFVRDASRCQGADRSYADRYGRKFRSSPRSRSRRRSGTSTASSPWPTRSWWRAAIWGWKPRRRTCR